MVVVEETPMHDVARMMKEDMAEKISQVESMVEATVRLLDEIYEELEEVDEKLALNALSASAHILFAKADLLRLFVIARLKEVR